MRGRNTGMLPASLAPWILCLCLCLCGGAAGYDAPDAPPPRLSLGQIRNIVSISHDRLRDLMVEYTARDSTKGSPERGTPVNRRIVQTSGASRFVSSIHSGEGFEENLDINYNIIFYNGKLILEYYPHFFFAKRLEGGAGRYAFKLKHEFLLECLGWCPPGDATEVPAGVAVPYPLPRVLSDTRCRIARDLERVGGSWCYVIERPPVDRIWLDPSVGFAMRRREWRPEGFPTATTYELSDYREALPEVWLPWKIRRSAIDPHSGSSDRSTSVEVRRIEVNADVDAGRFELAPGPGTLVYDADANRYSQVKGGLHRLDEILRLAEGRLDRYRKMSVSEGGRTGTTKPVFYAVLVIAACLILLTRFPIRKSHGREIRAAPGMSASPSPDPG